MRFVNTKAAAWFNTRPLFKLEGCAGGETPRLAVLTIH
ncbi:hypothetical protein PLANPX_5012 [Lacipirellula parvula]|uniref:Uncharacterized protein n=1 Tax=Lacipirellula parvula TaxID=2650471 RepID=A0A5K7XF21_9BACT|nr:hypothetical protein PLANPX_5012 [Lacipirellula parvula]